MEPDAGPLHEKGWNDALMEINRLLTALLFFLTGLLTTVNALASHVERVAALKPDLENGLFIYQLCKDCHTPNGWGLVDGGVPVISGQHRNVLIKQLEDFRDGNRKNEAMYPFSRDESIGGDQAIADVTAYISTLLMPANPETGPGENLVEGSKLYRERCGACHGPVGEGENERLYPRIHGQHYSYLVRQIELIESGERKNSDAVMVAIIKQTPRSDWMHIADFLSRQLPEPGLRAPEDWENPDFNYGFQ